MSRFEDRIAAPPALPPIRPPKGPPRDDGDWDGGGDWPKLPLWIKPRKNLGPIARVGVKFRAHVRDRRSFQAQSSSLTTCVVLKAIPPGARRSASMMSPKGYYNSKNEGWSLPGPKRMPRFKTKAERRRYSKRWLHGFTRETEYLLRGPHCYTFSGRRSMMEKTMWFVKLKLRVKTS